MLWHRQTIFESKGETLSSSTECFIQSWEDWDTKSPADGMPIHKPIELSRIKRKTWTQQPVRMISGHSTHLTSLPIAGTNFTQGDLINNMVELVEWWP